MRRWTEDERQSFSRKLSKYHAVFYRFFQVVSPLIGDFQSINTAAVYFDKAGRNFDFAINETFWKSLTETQQLFVVCHECLHVMLDHGRRGLGMDGERANKAQDVSINEMLVGSFGFSQKEIDPDGNYCWLSTIFPNDNFSPDRCFEFYYDKLPAKTKFPFIVIGGHGAMGGTGGPSEDGEDEKPSLKEEIGDSDPSWSPDEMEDLKDSLENELTDEEVESLDDILKNKDKDSPNPSRGIGSGGKIAKIPDFQVREQEYWSKYVRTWAKRKMSSNETYVWFGKSKRFALIDGVMLPQVFEQEKHKKDKENVWFFLDTSMSCFHMRAEFYRTARSIPKTHFNLRVFSFDCSVYELDLAKNEVKGGGGTSFSIINNFVNKEITDNPGTSYPTIHMITDGYGDYIKPTQPQKWNVFLTKGGSDRCFDEKMNIFTFAEIDSDD